MTSPLISQLEDYANHPFGLLYLKGLSVGRLQIDEASIRGREAAIVLHEYLLAALEFTTRGKILKNGTRRPETLPIGTPARPLANEIEDHLADMARRGLDPKTIDVTRRTLMMLLLTCGNIPVDRVDHQHIHQFWKLLRWAPKNLMSDPLLAKLTYEQAIARGKKEGVLPLAASTEERHRRFLNAFFNFMVNTNAIPASPMRAFKPPKEDDTISLEKASKVFEDEDLQRIFDPAKFLPWAKKPHLWWAPMIGLYTGARVNEVCQLKLIDIIQERGTWCFAFRKTVDADLAADRSNRRTSRQSFKGKACQRVIPIAHPLLDAGFLDFVEDIRATGHPRLFPHLSAGVNKRTGETNARYSQSFAVEFGRYLKGLGFEKGIGFHAFRHTLATELDVNDVPEDRIALITGHALLKPNHSPVLRKHYLHKRSRGQQVSQINALNKFQPPITLPVYVSGQFQKALSDPSKFYP